MVFKSSAARACMRAGISSEKSSSRRSDMGFFHPPQEGESLKSHTRLWLPSHSGFFALRLQAQKNALVASVALYSIGMKAEPLCEPSQNGCDFERPQAHHQ